MEDTSGLVIWVCPEVSCNAVNADDPYDQTVECTGCHQKYDWEDLSGYIQE